MNFDVITLFPEMFVGPLDVSMVKRARDKGLLDLRIHNLRDWTHDRHSRAVGRDCVHLQRSKGRHSRRQRLIGIVVPLRGLLSAARGPSTITVDVSVTVMMCHRRMAQGCRSVARSRSAATPTR